MPSILLRITCGISQHNQFCSLLTPPRVLMYFTTFATFAAAITVPATIKPIAAAHFAIFHADGSAITGNVVFHQN